MRDRSSGEAFNRQVALKILPDAFAADRLSKLDSFARSARGSGRTAEIILVQNWHCSAASWALDLGADEEADDFDQRVRARLDEELASLTGGKAPQDFVRVVQTIFELKQKGELADAAALLSWLSGSGNVATSIKRLAGIKGDIGSRDALAYLRGVLEIVKAGGYKGLLIVIDEAETILGVGARKQVFVAAWPS